MTTPKKTRSRGRGPKRTAGNSARLRVVVTRVVAGSDTDALILYVTAGRSTLRLIYQLPERTFVISEEDLCDALGLKVTSVVDGFPPGTRALMETRHVARPDGPATESTLRLAYLQWWLSVVTPDSEAGRRTISRYRRELHDSIWAALAKVKMAGGRLEWIGGSRAPDGPSFTDEQLAAELGVSPFVVRRAATLLCGSGG